MVALSTDSGSRNSSAGHGLCFVFLDKRVALFKIITEIGYRRTVAINLRKCRGGGPAMDYHLNQREYENSSSLHATASLRAGSRMGSTRTSGEASRKK